MSYKKRACADCDWTVIGSRKQLQAHRREAHAPPERAAPPARMMNFARLLSTDDGALLLDGSWTEDQAEAIEIAGEEAADELLAVVGKVLKRARELAEPEAEALTKFDEATEELAEHARDCEACRAVLAADGHPEDTCAEYARRWELWRAALAATVGR